MNKELTGIYRNYKLYDDKGKRLSVFAEKQNNNINFCIYRCSPKDQFNKKLIHEFYLNRNEPTKNGKHNNRFKSECFTIENVEYTSSNIRDILGSKYYKKVKATEEKVVQVLYNEKSNIMRSLKGKIIMN